MGLEPTDVGNIRFSKPPLGSSGYDAEQVDTFLDACTRFLTSTLDGDLSAPFPDMTGAEFDLRRSRGSYNRDEVDAFLDLLNAEALRLRNELRGRNTPDDAATRPTQQPPQHQPRPEPHIAKPLYDKEKPRWKFWS
jgi:DivIVA domain-containing protein